MGTSKSMVKFSNGFSIDPGIVKIYFFSFVAQDLKDYGSFACTSMIQGKGMEKLKVLNT